MRALDEDTRVFSYFSSSLLGQKAVSGNFTPHQWPWEPLPSCESLAHPRPLLKEFGMYVRILKVICVRIALI